jgi:hypothetical protein
LSAFGLWCLVSPRAVELLGLPLDSFLARVLVWPVWALNLILPPSLQSEVARYPHSYPHSVSAVAAYVVIGIIAYLLLLYLPSLVYHLRQRRAAAPSSHGA